MLRYLISSSKTVLFRLGSQRNYCQSLYTQGQRAEKKIREYFYYIDHDGMVLLKSSSSYLTILIRFCLFITVISGWCTDKKFHILLQRSTFYSIFLQKAAIQHNKPVSRWISIHFTLWNWTKLCALRWFTDRFYWCDI